MDTSDPHEPDDLAEVVEVLQDQEYAVRRAAPGVLDVHGRFSNPERIALAAAARSGDRPVAIWATNPRNDWVLVAWNRPDLVTITQKGTAPRRWRHRRVPERVGPAAQTFLSGEASPFDIVTRPKHQPTDEARAVLAGFGIDDPPPPGWEPPAVVAPEPSAVVVPVQKAKPRRTTARPATPRSTSTRTPEPTPQICPTCFMALPATGVCDTCG